MPRDVKSKSKGSVRGGGSGGGRRKQASSTGEGPSSVSGRLRSSSTNVSDHVGDGEVPVESVYRSLHGLDDPVAAGAALETGAPSASSSLVEDTSVEKTPPRPSHPAEGIGGLPTSSAADANAPRSPEAVHEGVPGDRSLSWDLTVDGVPVCDFRLLWVLVAEYPHCRVRFVRRLSDGALGRLAHQREQERVVQDELDRVARDQRKAEQDAWEKRLMSLKCKVEAKKQKVEAEELKTRNLFAHNQGLQAECDRLRVQRDGEQQLLAADRAHGDRVIADRMSELRGINDLIFAAKERQRELETIEEVSERSKESDETDEVD